MKAFLSEEQVSDYACEKCKRNVDAGRSVELVSVPPVLHIQLIRFVFDMKTGKEKISDQVAIPIEINMGDYLASPKKENFSGLFGGARKEAIWYDLHSVICHCGVSANGGHYIVYIRSGAKWWRLDDKKVAKMDWQDSWYFRHHDANFETPYFLVYLQRNFQFSAEPFSVSPNILEENERLRVEANGFDDKEREIREVVKGLRQERENILHHMALPPQKNYEREQEFYWINSEWLKNWLESPGEEETLAELDNNLLRCEHGKVGLDLSKMKRVTSLAWDYFSRKFVFCLLFLFVCLFVYLFVFCFLFLCLFFSLPLHPLHRGGPALSQNDLCQDCVEKKNQYPTKTRGNQNFPKPCRANVHHDTLQQRWFLCFESLVPQFEKFENGRDVRFSEGRNYV